MAFFNVTPSEKIDTLTETFGNGLNTSVREEEAKPDMFEGALGALGSGIESGFKRSKYNLFGTDTEEGVNRRREIAESVRKMQPDPKTMGSAAQIMFGIAEPLSFIGTQFMQDPITSIVAPSTLAMSVTKDFEPVQTELNKAQGMDDATARDLARTQSSAMGIGTILPTSVTGNLFTRILTGGALNVAVGAGERAESGRILRSAGYADMAKQYSALDGNAAAAEFILGGVFGGAFGARGKVRANPDAVLPSNIDAALAANQSVNANVDLAPGVPLNGKSAQAHSEALNTAIEQLALGEKVNVENLLTDAGFLGKRPDFDAVGIIRQELEKAGFNDVAAKVRDLETAAKQRGLYVDPADLNVVLSDAPAEIKVGGSRGRESEVKIGNDYVPVEYRLMEVGDVRATMDKADNQYRDRTRVSSERQISEAAANLDPRLLGESWTLDSGAPVMTADGKIIAGNGRAAFIERAYGTNSGGSYRSYLRDEAEALGINAGEIDRMSNPVLVRVLKKDVDVQKAAILSNEGGAMGMSALEQAKVDGERLGDFTAFQFGEDGSVANVSNMPFIRQWAGKFPTNQQSRLMDSDGKLSAEGSRRLQNAIMYRAYGDSDTLTRLVEATDPGSRNIVAALSRTAARVADAKEKIARGELYPLDLSDDLLNAVEKIDSLKRSGQTVDSWVAQLDAFGDGMSGEARALVVMMDRNIRSARAIGDAIDGYYARLNALGNPGQGSMFEAATPTKQDVFAPMLDASEVMYSREGSFSAMYEKITTEFLRDTGFADNILPNGKVLIYHGTSQKNADSILKSGKFKGNPFFSPDEAVAKQYSRQAGKNPVVLPLIVDPGAILPTGGYLSSRAEGLKLQDDGSWSLDESNPMYSRAQTQTPEFKTWFGESKVTDERGAPRVVYHGTTGDFEAFSSTKAGTTTGGVNTDLGFFFAGKPRTAGMYSTMSDIANDMNGGQNIIPAYVSIKNPLRFAAENMTEADSMMLSQIRPEHDGAIIDVAGLDTVYMVRTPEQIKSAIGNRGTFDPANPSILYGRGGTASNVADLTSTFKAQFGKDADKLTELGRVSIVQSVSDLPARSDATPHPGDVGGMYDPRTGVTYIVADNTAPSQIRGRILHEIGVHSGIETMLGDDLYASVLAQVDARIQSGDARFIEARRLAEANAARPEHVLQETLAYLVENAPESSVGRRILAAIRQWIYRTTGGRFVDLGVQDLVAMASASLRRQTRIDGVAMSDDGPWYTGAQQMTEAFRNWFGDSKVVDADGKPMVVYHGGPKFDEFRIPEGDDKGIYFTDNEFFAQDVFALQSELAARDRAGDNYADVPDDMANSGEWEAKYFKYAEVKPVYLKMNNPKIVDSLDAKLIPSLYEQGYDGVIVKSTGDFGYKGAQYVVFDPKQIKSATNNSGEFNPDNASILYSRQQRTEDFYRNANSGDILSSNDNPLITTMIPTGDIMEPIGLATAKADAEFETAVAMEPGFLSAIECALVAGE